MKTSDLSVFSSPSMHEGLIAFLNETTPALVDIIHNTHLYFIDDESMDADNTPLPISNL